MPSGAHEPSSALPSQTNESVAEAVPATGRTVRTTLPASSTIWKPTCADLLTVTATLTVLDRASASRAKRAGADGVPSLTAVRTSVSIAIGSPVTPAASRGTYVRV